MKGVDLLTRLDVFICVLFNIKVRCISILFDDLNAGYIQSGWWFVDFIDSDLSKSDAELQKEDIKLNI